MNENQLRIRARLGNGELEVEGDSQEVRELWEKLWPEMTKGAPAIPPSVSAQAGNMSEVAGPDIFGEYFTLFRSDITDVDRMLVAGQFAVEKDPERVFTTKVANQLLLDQNIKIGNPSEAVRRLVASKRAFVVSGGKFRVSSIGLEYLNSLKSKPAS